MIATVMAADSSMGTGYVAGGIGLTNSDPVSIGTTALWDFLDLSLASAQRTHPGGVNTRTVSVMQQSVLMLFAQQPG